MPNHESSHRDAPDNGHANGRQGALAGFIAGAAIGAGLALLLAPASGAETQERIGRFARKVKNGVGNGAEKAAAELGGVRHDVKAAVTAGREAFQQERDARHHDAGTPRV